MSAPETVRAFVALELDSELRRRMAALVQELRPLVSGGRWVRPEAVHLTLRFLGSASPDQLFTLRTALAAASRACPPAQAPVAELGTFPPRGRPRVLWLGIALPDSVLRLQEACEAAAVAAGFAPETRSFRPHLTLARFKTPARLPELPAVDLGAARLERLHLMRSDLRPEGARYTVVDGWSLVGGE